MEIKSLIESHLTEASVAELLDISIRDKKGKQDYSVSLEGFNFETKTFKFQLKDKYDCHLRLPSLKVISRLKGNDKEKLNLALDDEIQVNCSCPDFKYRFRYVADKYDASTKKENRPPDFTNPNYDGAICKHLHSLLRRIESYSDKMVELIDKSRKNNYKVV